MVQSIFSETNAEYVCQSSRLSYKLSKKCALAMSFKDSKTLLKIADLMNKRVCPLEILMFQQNTSNLIIGIQKSFLSSIRKYRRLRRRSDAGLAIQRE